ncbi:MAG: hypothetical protein HZB72_14920 [Burkholderiales bacterium]|nr:hypothetical protein [Burkholderiales bacterium]
MPLCFLLFDRAETADGHAALEGLASTGPLQHAAAMAEVQQVLDWAHQAFPQGPGPLDEGHDWDHDLQVREEPGGWRTVTLTLAASAAFAQAFEAAFPTDEGA